MRRTVRTLALTTALLVAAPSAALAHECLNASRSDNGSRNAQHGNWVYVSEDEVVEVITEIAGVDPDEYGDAFLEALDEAGLARSFSIFIGNHTIGANPKTHEVVAAYADGTKSVNGKGIDHAEALIGAYLEILFEVVGA